MKNSLWKNQQKGFPGTMPGNPQHIAGMRFCNLAQVEIQKLAFTASRCTVVIPFQRWPWREGNTMEKMKRLDQIVLIGTFIGFSWLAMQAVHELGHVLGALIGGGTINKVVLYPNTISRTDVYPNPHHLLEVWSGCIVGALLPFLVFLVAARCRSPGLYLFRFFAGFCLLANGVYIGVGSFHALADAEELLILGAQKWQLFAFGVLTLPVGLYLWHGLGPAFGLGKADGKVSRAAAMTSIGLFAAIMGIEMVIGSK